MRQASCPEGKPMRDPRISVISGKGGGLILKAIGMAAAGKLNMSSEIKVSMFSAKFALPPHVRVKRSQSNTRFAGSESLLSFEAFFRIRSDNRTRPIHRLISYCDWTML